MVAGDEAMVGPLVVDRDRVEKAAVAHEHLDEVGHLVRRVSSAKIAEQRIECERGTQSISA